MTSKLKNWAKRKGPRWITQQSFQALTACLLTVMAATHGHTSDLFLYGAMATITGDSLCLWTGNPRGCFTGPRRHRRQDRTNRDAIRDAAARVPGCVHLVRLQPRAEPRTRPGLGVGTHPNIRRRSRSSAHRTHQPRFPRRAARARTHLPIRSICGPHCRGRRRDRRAHFRNSRPAHPRGPAFLVDSTGSSRCPRHGTSWIARQLDVTPQAVDSFLKSKREHP